MFLIKEKKNNEKIAFLFNVNKGENDEDDYFN